MRLSMGATALALVILGAWPAGAAPLIPGYGQTASVEQPGVPPNPALDYKVVVNVTRAVSGPEDGLQKAARLANLLALSGVPAERRHIVVIISGPATADVLTDAAMKARGKGPNPEVGLIAALQKAGVAVHVCGQAVAGMKIARSEILPGVQVDLSALTTLATLQLEGYALEPA